MGGYTPNPTYEETCTGRTGHAETVRVVYDPAKTIARAAAQGVLGEPRPDDAEPAGQRHRHRLPLGDLLDHRRAARAAEATRDAFQKVLNDNGFGEITTEIRPAEDAGEFYLAEDYHQGYLHKNPGGYCNHGPNGMTCPVGIVRQDQLPSQQEIAPPAS